MSEFATVSLNKLVPSPANVRRRMTDIPELAASLAAKGFLQNLVVKKAAKGRYEVVAGGRRLAAAKQLVADGTWTADRAVPVQVIDGDETTVSLMENTARANMTVVEEVKAFARLAEEGRSPEDIAATFGLSIVTVRQRQKLAALHPVLLEALDEGQMTLELAQAYAVSDDQLEQLAVYEDWERHRQLSGDYDRLEEEQSALEQESYNEIDQQYVGAVVCIGNGDIRVQTGLVAPEAVEDWKKAKRQEGDPSAGQEPEAEPDAPQIAGLSKAVVNDLCAIRTAALGIELAKRPDIALATIVYTLLLSKRYSYKESSCCQIRAGSASFSSPTLNKDESPAFAELDAIREDLFADAPEDGLFAWVLSQSQESLLAMLAKLVSLAVSAHVNEKNAYEHSQALAAALSLDMTHHWQAAMRDVFCPDGESLHGAGDHGERHCGSGQDCERPCQGEEGGSGRQHGRCADRNRLAAHNLPQLTSMTARKPAKIAGFLLKTMTDGVYSNTEIRIF